MFHAFTAHNMAGCAWMVDTFMFRTRADTPVSGSGMRPRHRPSHMTRARPWCMLGIPSASCSPPATAHLDLALAREPLSDIMCLLAMLHYLQPLKMRDAGQLQHMCQTLDLSACLVSA